MIGTLQKTIYTAFGLKVESEFALPELHTSSFLERNVDVQITLGDLTDKWRELSIKGTFMAKPNFVLFRVPDTAIFLIQEGEKVIVSPMEGSDQDKIRLYILGTCMGAILMQRKILPLHGSAVAINGKAYAIVGDSGAGKSTLASTFINNGYQFLSDDVIAVSLSEDDNSPYVMPSYPQQKLWQKSLTELGMDIENYMPLFEREDKFAVPVQIQFSSTPLPLAGIFELTKTEGNEIEIQPVPKLESLYKMYCHTYRQFLIQMQELTGWHFQISSTISDQVIFYKLERPVSSFTANDLMDLIITTIKMEELNND